MIQQCMRFTMKESKIILKIRLKLLLKYILNGNVMILDD